MHPQDDDPGGTWDPLTLSAVAKLRVLDISGCYRINSIDAVRSCVQLRCLWMPGCFRVSDLSPLAACSETLEELWMAHNEQIDSLAPLKACTRLRKIDLRGCNSHLRDQVEDLRLTCIQLADPASVKIEGSVHNLQPSFPTYMQAGAAAALIDVIRGGGVEAKAAIAAAGAIPALVQLLASDSPGVQMTAASALCILACGHAQSQAAIALAGAIPAFVQLLRPGPEGDLQRAAASALSSLAAEHTANQAAFAAAGAIPLLVQLQGSTYAHVREAATGALLHLAAFRA
jgi:hypothetical protein